MFIHVHYYNTTSAYGVYKYLLQDLTWVGLQIKMNELELWRARAHFQAQNYVQAHFVWVERLWTILNEYARVFQANRSSSMSSLSTNELKLRLKEVHTSFYLSSGSIGLLFWTSLTKLELQALYTIQHELLVTTLRHHYG